MFKKKDIFTKIDEYLKRKSHDLVMSMYLENYNGNKIYIRFDYVDNLSVYKVIWVDLNFIDDKNIEQYLNMQTVTKILADNFINSLEKTKYENSNYLNDNILGDRVHIKIYKSIIEEYTFDRFLPIKWQFLIDPIVICFSYLPRSMEVFLNEMFAKFDELEDKYNYLKPMKLNIFDDSVKKVFKPNVISRGTTDYKAGLVAFLEKIDNRYVAIVDDNEEPIVVIIEQINEEFVRFWCNCQNDNLCKHIYSVILAIRDNKFNIFYKVKYLNDYDLLDKVTNGTYNLCFGYQDDCLLILDDDYKVYFVPIVENGKVMFEVLVDDDELSLSKEIDRYRKKD